MPWAAGTAGAAEQHREQHSSVGPCVAMGPRGSSHIARNQCCKGEDGSYLVGRGGTYGILHPTTLSPEGIYGVMSRRISWGLVSKGTTMFSREGLLSSIPSGQKRHALPEHVSLHKLKPFHPMQLLTGFTEGNSGTGAL